MGVKLTNEKRNDFHPSEMLDGAIGQIVRIDGSREYIGRIVQRCGGRLVAIGYGSGYMFPNACDPTPPRDLTTFRVRILQPGETLEIT